MEGGAIAQPRQAPPGADQPYPNLADVPAAPVPTPAGEQDRIAQVARGDIPSVSAPNPGALAGLDLPTAAPPPPPNIPHPAAAPAPTPAPVPVPAAAPPPPSVPVALAFPPGSSVLPASEIAALHNLALAHGNARVLAGGFGDGTSLPLAIARARRLADELTAGGVPPSAVDLTAMAAGYGGFVQLVY